MGSAVDALLLDTHALHWWSAEPDRLSKTATAALERADALAVASISWFELAWLASRERIVLTVPIRSWLDDLASQVLTLGITPAIADIASGLPASFPGDPADRLIYATAVNHGVRVVTKDKRLRSHKHPRSITVW